MINNEYSSYKIIHHINAIKNNNPPHAILDLTALCNHNCKRCISKKKELFNPNDSIKLKDMLSISDQLKELGVKAINVTGGGEPTIHPDINEILADFFKKGFEVSLTTNGTLLNNVQADLLQKLTWIRISIDAYYTHTYHELRGNHSLDWGWFRYYLGLMPEVTKGCSFIVQPENYQEIYPFVTRAKDVGFDNCRITYSWSPEGIDLDRKIKQSAIKQFRDLEKNGINDEAFSLFSMTSRLMPQKIEYDHCYYSDGIVVIGADANVYRCCPLKYTQKGYLGNLYKMSLIEIWQGRGEQDLKDCPLCYAHDKNLLASYVFSKPKHVNFI